MHYKNIIQESVSKDQQVLIKSLSSYIELLIKIDLVKKKITRY